MSKLFLGSVAEQVLGSANLPVTTVGPEAHLTEESNGPMRVVLHATELRETSSWSAALACQIAASQKAKLVLLHVLPPIDETQSRGRPTRLDSTAMHELRVLAAKIDATEPKCCAQVETLVMHGNPSIEILAASVEQHASLIVLGATHRPVLQMLTRDRTIYRVLAHARCPILRLRNPHSPLAPNDEQLLASHI